MGGRETQVEGFRVIAIHPEDSRRAIQVVANAATSLAEAHEALERADAWARQHLPVSREAYDTLLCPPLPRPFGQRNPLTVWPPAGL